MDYVDCPIWGRAAYIDWCAHGQPAVGDIVLGQHDDIVTRAVLMCIDGVCRESVCPIVLSVYADGACDGRGGGEGVCMGVAVLFLNSDRSRPTSPRARPPLIDAHGRYILCGDLL